MEWQTETGGRTQQNRRVLSVHTVALSLDSQTCQVQQVKKQIKNTTRSNQSSRWSHKRQNQRNRIIPMECSLWWSNTTKVLIHVAIVFICKFYQVPKTISVRSKITRLDCHAYYNQTCLQTGSMMRYSSGSCSLHCRKCIQNVGTTRDMCCTSYCSTKR